MIKKSTYARVNLILYGMNCTGFFFSITSQNYLFLVWNACWIAWTTAWFSKNYFDVEESKKENDNEQTSS